MREGSIELGELILVGAKRDDPMIVLEGHTRATAYAMSDLMMFEMVAAVVGLSESMTHWAFF